MISSRRYGSKVRLNNLQNGDISYYVVYKAAGKTIYKKVGKRSEGITEKKALDLRNQILSEQRHGIDLSQKSSKNLTFDKLAEIYFLSNEAHNKSNKKYQQMYENHIKPSFGDVTISRCDDSLIYQMQQLKISDGKSESTINIIVKLIKRIVGHGIKRGIITYSPFKAIKLFKINNTRLRYLSKSEIDQLHKMIQDDQLLKVFVKIALSTGARIGSILYIQMKHIDFENKTIQIHDFKRGNDYTGFMDEETHKLLAAHTALFNANDFAVSLTGSATRYGKIYKDLSKVFEVFNQGLAKDDRTNRVVNHTLRHTFASHLAIAGVSIQKIQKLMNHKDINQTMKYAKLSKDSGRDHVEELYKGK